MINENISITEPNRNKKNKNNLIQNKSFDSQKDGNIIVIKNLTNKLNDAEKKITALQKKVKELQYQLEERQVEKEISAYRTEDVNFSNYEEEFDLKKMVNGARYKNR
jgi:TolA-binding protein